MLKYPKQSQIFWNINLKNPFWHAYFSWIKNKQKSVLLEKFPPFLVFDYNTAIVTFSVHNQVLLQKDTTVQWIDKQSV